ncbi:MAG TPA: SdpI family protein [Ktedonobacteraceae bacterium]|nr:SdpI family protein [Ktedonobacteraceae bacterium]
MNPSESNSDKITPQSTFFTPATLFALAVIAAQILISLITYPFLPDTVPTHWNLAGQVNSYAPKWVNAILFPLISIGLFVLIRFLIAVGPRLGSQNARRANQEVVNLIINGVLLLLLVLQLMVTAISLGMKLDINFVMILAVSILFIFIGNYMGKLRRNFWAGIRTPWTLTSDVVWERTHRLGGWLFVIGGLLGVIVSFVPWLRIWGFMVILVVIIAIPVVYSYLAYQHYTVEGREPLSPPFDNSGRG